MKTINEQGKEKKKKCRGRRRIGDEVEKKKMKIKLSLYLIERHAIKAYWGSGYIAPCILNLRT
jgi:hypothetical protein